jgi:hypothetical protein
MASTQGTLSCSSYYDHDGYNKNKKQDPVPF